jgi:hypothetical protein
MMKLLLLFLMLVMLSTCEAQSKLPKEMPAGTVMTYTSGGGFVPSFFSAKVSGTKLTITSRSAQARKEVGDESTLSDDEVNALYQAFVESKIDTLKPNQDIGVADGRSRTIELKFGESRYFAINGDGYDPPKGHGERFKKVEDAFGKIISAHKKQ